MSSNTFGQLLRRHRLAAGFSQEQLAALAGISAEAVGALERGTRRAPYRHTVGLLGEALKLRLQERSELEATADTARTRKPRPPSLQELQPAIGIPVPSTPFVGRAEEIATVTGLCAKSRVVTMTGFGGIGKTRLALAVGAERMRLGAERVCFVEFGPLADPLFIPVTVAAALDLADEPVNTLDQLVVALRSLTVALILDNCEHLSADVAAAVVHVLRRCEGVSFLVTSREPLGIDDEIVYRLQPMRVPGTTPATLTEARRYSAVDLFVQRAMTYDSFGPFDDRAVDPIVEICRKVEGIPLALELAAARAATLGLNGLRDRLSDVLTLTATRRPAVARQETMAATIGWSYNLLNDVEKTVLARAAVFSGSFSLEAAEFVCIGGPITREPVADALSSLVEKSLVNVSSSGSTARYSMLASVQAYAQERLRDLGEASIAAERHAQWVAEFADFFNTQYGVMTRAGWMQAVLPDLENARAALTWCYADRDEHRTLLGARIAGGLRRLWASSGRFPELRTWVETALARLSKERHPAVFCTLLKARLNYTLRVPDRITLCEHMLALCDRLDDDAGVAQMLTELVPSLCFGGRFEEARRRAVTAEAVIAERFGRFSIEYAGLMLQRGSLNAAQGRFEEGRADLALAEEIGTALGEEYFIIRWCRLLMAETEYYAGNLDGAIERLETLLQSAFALAGDKSLLLWTNFFLAMFRLFKGDLRRAEHAAREALTRTNLHPPLTLVPLSAALALRGQARLAARLFGFVEAWFAEHGQAFRAYEQRCIDVLNSSLRNQISAVETDAIKREGSYLPAAVAIEEALRAIRA